MSKTMLSKDATDKLIKFYGSRQEAQRVVDYFNEVGFRVMHMCPRCKHSDVHPLKHVEKCDPAGQAQRDYDWINDVGDRE